jgi:hypothetical protein
MKGRSSTAAHETGEVRMSRIVPLLLVVLALTGCLEFLRVVVDDTHSLQPTFRFRSRRPRGGSETVNLLVFTVSIKGGVPEDVVWKVESPAGRVGKQRVQRPPPLRHVRYGVVPEGFVTDVPPRPLIWGKTYRMDAALKVEGRESVVGAGGEFVPEVHDND